MKYLGTVVGMVATSSELCLLLQKARNSKRAAIAEKKSKQGIWRPYFAEKRAEFYHRGYAVLDEFVDASKVLIKVFNLLDRPASFRWYHCIQHLSW